LNHTKRKALQLKVDTLLEDVPKRIVPVGGDMRSFRLNQKFGLVIAPFRAFLHNRVSSVSGRGAGRDPQEARGSSQDQLPKGHNLIAWLERVRAGEEVLVSDLQRPIARLLPVEISDEVDAEELEMAAAGLAPLPNEELPESFWEVDGAA